MRLKSTLEDARPGQQYQFTIDGLPDKTLEVTNVEVEDSGYIIQFNDDIIDELETSWMTDDVQSINRRTQLHDGSETRFTITDIQPAEDD
jgi:hypothetical protein